MTTYSVDEFLSRTKQQITSTDSFALQSERILEVNLDGEIWSKMGSMISYQGTIRFERERILEHGLGRAFKKSFTSEGQELMKATGNGRLFLADQGKRITILELGNQQITVNGNDLLAFEPTVEWDIEMMRKMAGLMSGGLFNVTLNGRGKVAITTYFEPLTLEVTPDQPVHTDPTATVAWSGDLKPEFHTDISYRTFLGKGSGESIQMKFTGSGFVIVQPGFEVE
ncbi:AIM24 family protein [Alkalicoccobacillus gibsonii]|uniref:AIM24 family protein n=1 Tax=Alkalicoccobacillus gibsonii TaxID=79881 RepID=A0ABU9VNJ3_9BACI|nr:AIM24 family protein [Alkalicoccobacillus gibsonii]MBM0065511.1 AIM24 family protein [Alkalicoccobacillus gibsonii]